MSQRHRLAAAAPAAFVAALAILPGGCKLGPNFASPAAPHESGYIGPGEHGLPTSGAPGEAKQRLALGAKVAADWWTIFRSPALDGVMKEALADSPTIAEAQATLVEAQEQAVATAGGLLPQVNLAAGISRQAVNVEVTGTPRSAVSVNVFQIGPTVNYALDVFGGLKRQVEAEQANAAVSRYQLAAAYLSLTGNVAIQAITIASVRAETQTVNRIVADDDKNLSLVKTAQQAGTENEVDVTAAESQLANDRTLLPPLQQQLAVAQHALTVYLGKSPADWTPPDFALPDLTVPSTLPVSLPSQLVRQRPDILAAEAKLHVASAEIGVATANLYPNITLSANITQAATHLNNFFSGLYTGYGIGPELTAPIFYGGTLKAQQRAAYAAFNAAFATYRQTVIQAFGQVADALQALDHDDEDVTAQAQAAAIAAQALRLARLSFQEGNSTLLQVLDAERLAERANIGLVQAQSRRVLDTAELFVSLGSGWWNTPPTKPATAPKA